MVLVSLSSREDPLQAAESFSAQVEPALDRTHTAHLGKLLWNMQHHRSMPVVEQLHLSTSSAASFAVTVSPLEIRYGDDLDQVVRWQILNAIKWQQNCTSIHDSALYPRVEDLIADTTAQIKATLLEFQSTRWRQTRALNSSSIAAELSLDGRLSEGNNCIALVVVACK